MAKVQKLKKQKSGMSPEAKETLGNAFKGIISNQCCVDGGKNGPWWVAAIFLVLSIMLPLIPIMVTQSKSYGAAPFASYNYGTKEGIFNTFTIATSEKYEAKIEGGLMSFTKDGSELSDDIVNNVNAEPIIRDYVNDSASYKTYNFDLFVTNLNGSILQTFINNISARKYECGTLTPYDASKEEQYKEEGTKFYTPSFMVLARSTMGVAAYKYGTTTLGCSTYGGLTWTNTPNGDLFAYILGADLNETFNNFKNVLNQTYIEQKGITFRTNVLIYFGVYTGLILFLGLLLFILTRGKRNVFNFLSFFQCQKIAWWASFTPALLGMIFAFIFSTNMIGQMSFVIFVALRIMWLSMRQLRPVQ